MKDNTIIVYTTNWCPYCDEAKDYLAEKEIDFIEKNIEEDLSAKEEMVEKIGGRYTGVPVIDINGEIIDGFSPRRINKALKRLV